MPGGLGLNRGLVKHNIRKKSEKSTKGFRHKEAMPSAVSALPSILGNQQFTHSNIPQQRHTYTKSSLYLGSLLYATLTHIGQSSLIPPYCLTDSQSQFAKAFNMPSSLRNQVVLSTTTTSPVTRTYTASPPQKKQKMSLTQTYYLAHTARGKLSKEAAKGDHDLRLLVGHANLLDGLMLDLANAEQEQENWFNQTVKSNTKASDEPKHIQWADTIPEEVEEAVEEEFYADNSDSDSDSDEEEEADYPQPTPRKAPQASAIVTSVEVDEDDDEEMIDDDYEDSLALTRTPSIHPPELLHGDSDSDSDDDMPPSPPQTEIPLDAFTQKQRQAIATTSFYQSDTPDHPASLPESDQSSFFDEGFYLPQRQPMAIAAF